MCVCLLSYLHRSLVIQQIQEKERDQESKISTGTTGTTNSVATERKNRAPRLLLTPRQ